MDELQNRLFSLPDWGYVIYRITYTAGSDTSFPHAIRYIEACLKNEFFREVTQQPWYRNNDIPADVWSKYQSTIKEDPNSSIRCYYRRINLNNNLNFILITYLNLSPLTEIP